MRESSSKRDQGLLAQIERDVLDESKPLAGTLRKCITIGKQSGSAPLRDWAARELKGYDGPDELPEYRVIMAPIRLDGVTWNAIIKGQPISPMSLPDFAAEHISERVELRQSVGELESLVGRRETDGEPIRLSLPMGADLATYMNQVSGNSSQQIQALYWAVEPAVIRGVLDRVRTALTELVAEMRAETPDDAELPSAETATQAVNVAVHGAKSRVTVTTAQASGQGHAVVGEASHDDEESGFWTRSRRIGAFVVGLAAIITAIAAVLTIPH